MGLIESSEKINLFGERLRKQKSTDSIKRIGITATVRYTQDGGFITYMGPWWFFYPGQKTMQHVLPMIFSIPALLVTILGLLLRFDSIMDAHDVTMGLASSISNNTTSISTSVPNAATSSLPSTTSTTTTLPSTTINGENTIGTNKIKSNIKNAKKHSKSNITTTATVNDVNKINNNNVNIYNNLNNNPNNNNNVLNTQTNTENKTKKRKYRRPKGVKFWHDYILKWASTKTTGLGYNLEKKYKGLNDASLGSRVVFEIQSFYPFPKTMKKLSSMSFFRSKPIVTSSIPDLSSSSSSGSIPSLVPVSVNDRNSVYKEVKDDNNLQTVSPLSSSPQSNIQSHGHSQNTFPDKKVIHHQSTPSNQQQNNHNNQNNRNSHHDSLKTGHHNSDKKTNQVHSHTNSHPTAHSNTHSTTHNTRHNQPHTHTHANTHKHTHPKEQTSVVASNEKENIDEKLKKRNPNNYNPYDPRQ